MISVDQSEASIQPIGGYFQINRIIPGTKEGMVALLTKWFSVSLEKVLSAELHVTLAAGEAARVPGAAQGGDHLQY